MCDTSGELTLADLLLEIFSEEIPARMQRAASEQLSSGLSKALQEARLEFTGMKSFVTPRRLAVLMEGLPTQQPDVTVEKKGPKTSAPQAAIDGFLKSSGLSLVQLEKRMVGKDETYFAVTEQKGQPAADAIRPIIEKILAEFSWPKSMRWGSHEKSWVRPMHSILCLFDGKILPVQWQHITAGNVTRGHCFLVPEVITITNAQEYAMKLEAAKVLADQAARREIILRDAKKLAAEKGLSLKEDEGLLDEVTGLVEWPMLALGRIDDNYMDLPPEVLTSEMRAHQKYFALQNKDGSLAPWFVITGNMITSDGGKAVIAGNERVLRARLADGRFYWDQDRKKPLSEWAKGLKDVIFHAKIGNVAEKVSRIEKLASVIADAITLTQPSPLQGEGFKKLVSRAAELCKADLVSGMVGEFPELQGIMGRYYALQQKEDARVADAIRDHYLPLGPNTPCPTEPVAVCVSLADKFDTLISMFAIGEKPTGSKDPFALRRAALGMIRIILENNLRLPLRTLLSSSCGLTAGSQTTKVDPAVKPQDDELLAFFSDRLQVMLKDRGIRHDFIKAVFDGGKEDDLVRIVARVNALKDFLETEDGKNLLAAYKRAVNILSIEEKKDKVKFEQVDPALFEVDEEKTLSQALAITNQGVDTALKGENYIDAMKALAGLRQPIDQFFDKVMVNCENKDLRKTRLGLLNTIRTTMDSIANFGLIEG